MRRAFMTAVPAADCGMIADDVICYCVVWLSAVIRANGRSARPGKSTSGQRERNTDTSIADGLNAISTHTHGLQPPQQFGISQ